MTDKKFGLIIPKRVDKLKMRAKSIFDDDSDEEEKQCKRPKIPQKKIDVKKQLKEESLDDPSIYEYDSIYDDMKAKAAESIAPKEKKNSRYIDTLLKASDKRKKEYERRIDKKIQLEREKEGDMYKDKEAFVTSSYKKKLQEKEEEEERERRENMLNDMMDITKQKDLSGFYRHFLKQTVGEEKVPAFGEKYIKKEVSCNNEESNSGKVVENSKDVSFEDPNVDQDSDGVEIDTDEDKNIYSSGESTSKKHATATTSQKYSDKEEKVRKSKTENRNVLKDKSKLSRKDKYKEKYIKKEVSCNEESNSGKVVENSKDVSFEDPNVDQDSDGVEIDTDEDKDIYSSGESTGKKHATATTSQKYSDMEEKVRKSKAENCNVLKDKSKLSRKEENIKTYNKRNSNSSTSDSDSNTSEDVNEKTVSQPDVIESSETNIQRPRHDSSSDDEVSKKSDSLKEQNKLVKKDRKSIYEKRTVGDAFIAAQTRYFQRMALKSEK